MGFRSTGDWSQATLTPADGDLCPLWLASISVVLYQCPTSLHCLHACTRNSPLMSLALHRTHFNPTHPSSLVVVVGVVSGGSAILNLWANSHFLSCSCISPIKKIAWVEMNPYMQTFVAPFPPRLPLWNLFMQPADIETVWLIAATARLKDGWIRVILGGRLKCTFRVVPEPMVQQMVNQPIHQLMDCIQRCHRVFCKIKKIQENANMVQLLLFFKKVTSHAGICRTV